MATERSYFNVAKLKPAQNPLTEIATSRFTQVSIKPKGNIGSTLTTDQAATSGVKFLAVGVNVSQNANVSRQFVIGSHKPQILTGTVINTLQFSMLATQGEPAAFHLLGQIGVSNNSINFTPAASIGETATDKSVSDPMYVEITITYGPGGDVTETYENCVLSSYSISANAGDVIVLENVVFQCGYYDG